MNENEKQAGVQAICTAYDEGAGLGYDLEIESVDVPYPPGSAQAKAFKLGFDRGRECALEDAMCESASVGLDS